MKRHERASTFGEERGIYIPLLAIVFTAIIAVFSLGVDLGKMYIESLRQQRAADAATIVAAASIGTFVGGSPLTKPEIEDLARRVAEDNFVANKVGYNVALPADHILAEYDNGVSTIAVDTVVKYDSLFVGKITPGKSIWDIGGRAVAKRRPLNVTFVLDITGSMDENADPACVGAGCRKKMRALQDAAVTFVDKLDETKDRVAVVWFNEAAGTSYDLVPSPAPAGKHFDKNDVEASIRALTPRNKTNIALGLRQGRTAASPVGLDQSAAKRVMILITDGAPNIVAPGFTMPCVRSNVEKQAQVLAALESDLIRSDGITLFTIAVGPADPYVPGPSDINPDGAFQTFDDWYVIKRVLLTRVANAYSQAAAYKEFPTDCIPSYDDIADKPAGQYLESPNANDLTSMLARLLKTIQMQLIE